MKINLKNKTYVISAAADGIGFAIAKKIISAGGKAYISDINKSLKKHKQFLSKRPLKSTFSWQRSWRFSQCFGARGALGTHFKMVL